MNTINDIESEFHEHLMSLRTCRKKSHCKRWNRNVKLCFCDWPHRMEIVWWFCSFACPVKGASDIHGNMENVSRLCMRGTKMEVNVAVFTSF